MLDFFGVPVKAQELLTHLAHMRLLAKRLAALESAGRDLPPTFRLDAASAPPQAKWGRAIGWTPRDDAMLLLGVYWHGMGHWEAIVGSERLGLGGKLASVLAPAAGGGAGEGSSGGGAAAAGKDKDKELLPKGEGVGRLTVGGLLLCRVQVCDQSLVHSRIAKHDTHTQHP
jgi:hypothetical protein